MTGNFIALLAAFIFSVFPGHARTILTGEAECDYETRMCAQPRIASQATSVDGMSAAEEEAMKFLYAYMATPDALDYTPEFYLENVRLALRASEEMPWGANVPDREWRHFVLPVRVNNENLDHARREFYSELKDRVKGLSMAEAILEVNHWCHEKVSYQPSDARTSSPLATVRNALGRCGEESTFTVAALRSIGIPARQIYTPRWAHTDDNHAWVEAWADGRWYFLGACEPEPVLNMAWFNEPATRGMLMTTTVTGRYDGPEEVIESTPISTVINVTDNYAPVSTSGVYVTDRQGNPSVDATVLFTLYNYAELYPLAEKHTDSNGYASFTSGRGDIVAWATDGEHYNWARLTAGDTISLALDKDKSYIGTADFDLTPPPTGVAVSQVSNELLADNERRKAYEDSVRLKYTSGFISDEKAREICRETGLDISVADALVKARGNLPAVISFLQRVPAELRGRAAALLGVLEEKDLHDISVEALEDHLYNTFGNEDSPLYMPFVLNPRVEIEMIHPYKRTIRELLTPHQIETFRANPQLVADCLAANIESDTIYNPGELRQSPISALTGRIADKLNREIAFVAICRSLGIPARINPVNHIVQYADETDTWHDLASVADCTYMGGSEMIIAEDEATADRNPKYYSHFTLSEIKDGKPQLMEFEDFEGVQSINDRRYMLSPGQYLMVTGQRMADGTVLAHTDIFSVGETPVVKPRLILRQDSTALQVIGNLDAELNYTPVTFEANQVKEAPERSILSSTGRGYYILGFIAPGHEPSSHALNDIAMAKDELEKAGNKILLLFADTESAGRYRTADYGALPAGIEYGIDTDGRIAEAVRQGLELSDSVTASMPYFVIADTFNRIVYAHGGYTIHLGSTLAHHLTILSHPLDI
ncbi:MAG: transglutaminase-like domain-containing protein [Muribaculaceae bacterium]|nr:transglutaminase-like domain-containing protein [Muribaculaceae bacterium]